MHLIENNLNSVDLKKGKRIITKISSTLFICGNFKCPVSLFFIY